MFQSSNEMDVDEPESSASNNMLSTQTLQAAEAEREVERQRRLKDGNTISRKQNKVGKRLDDLTHRLVIERSGQTATGAPCKIYYCIGCDEESRNIARGRSLAHAYGCDVSTLKNENIFLKTANLEVRKLQVSGLTCGKKLRRSCLIRRKAKKFGATKREKLQQKITAVYPLPNSIWTKIDCQCRRL